MTLLIAPLLTAGIAVGSIQNVYAPEDGVPVADANGPYSAELGNSIMFDGSGSSDPDGDALTFDWNFGDGNFGIDAFPEHTYLSVGTFQVCLTVDDGNGEEDTACTTAEIVDTTPPDITCPPNVAINTGEDTSPATTGEATATDDPNPDPIPTFSDVPFQNPDGTTTIVRTWTATDAAGNTASCSQIITVLPLPVDIDIKPGSDPNSVNVNTKGVLPVAILGGPDLDVEEIDISSVAGVTTSVDFAIADLWVALPLRCSVGDVNDDGILDLNCKFSKNELMLDCWTSGLIVSGNLLDGTPFIGSDTIRPVPCDEDF